MNIRDGIIEAANELGMSPIVLATIISYETGGTFNPTQAGPTTQWGQHRGLIQFGEPQAQEYGVNWSDPVGSQLGRDGAIVKYFRRNGWTPGMGMLDAYSIVNSGAPGRYSASDANNGGAAGDVRNKVETQMGGHRNNAAALLGVSGPPTETAPPTNDAARQRYEYASGKMPPDKRIEYERAAIRNRLAIADPLAAYAQRIAPPIQQPASMRPLAQFAQPTLAIENQFAQLLGAAKGAKPNAR